MAYKTNRVRVAGSGFTAFFFGGQPIAFCEQVSHTSAQPVAPATPIQPMDEPRPVQIITPAAGGPGTIVLQLTELYGYKVWDRLGVTLGYSSEGPAANASNFTRPGESNNANLGDGLLSGAVDIVDVFIRVSQAPPNTINVVKYIRPPALGGEPKQKPFTEEYMGCVISDIEDGEQVGVASMQVVKNITVMYTHVLRNGKRPLDLQSRL
jgi:hypothetical protein